MPLPSISAPEFVTQIPSTKQEINFRPFLVREEKILYMASESGEPEDIASAMNTILKSCLLTETDVNELAYFDVEFLFLQLRAKSVGEQIELKLKHSENIDDCDGETECLINLEDIKVDNLEKDEESGLAKNVIMLDENMSLGITMKYPTSNMIAKIQKIESDVEKFFTLAETCVVNVFDADDVYHDFTPEELQSFIDGLSSKQFENLKNFFNDLPKLTHKIDFVCSKCGNEDTVTLEGASSFFT